MSSLRRFNLDFGRWPLHHTTPRWSSQEHAAAMPENDTIVSAAAVALMQVMGSFPIEWFYGDGAGGASGIACSSLLPIIWDGDGGKSTSESSKKTGKLWLYLPIPSKTLKIDTNSRLHLMKIVNGIAWLRADLWRIWAEGNWYEAAEIVLAEHFEDKARIPDKLRSVKAPLALAAVDSRWAKQYVHERVTLHPNQLRQQAMADANNDEAEAEKLLKASVPYRVTSFRFADNAGAALMVDGKDPKQIEQFALALNLLGHSGLGGDRTYGYGTFNILPNSNDPSPDKLGFPDGKAALTLGLLFPGQSKSIRELNGKAESESTNAGDVPSDARSDAANPHDVECFPSYFPPLRADDSRWKAIYRQGRNRIPDTNFYVMSKSVRMVDKGALLEGLPKAANANGASSFPVGGSVNMFPNTYQPDEPLKPYQKCIVRSGRTIALKASACAVDG